MDKGRKGTDVATQWQMAQCGQGRPRPCHRRLTIRAYAESAKQGSIVRNSEQAESHEMS